MKHLLVYLLIPFLAFCLAAPLKAREAAFLAPQKISNIKGGDEAIIVEPGREVSIGETSVNIARKTTAVFVNMSSQPVDVVSMTTTGDSNVRADIVGDDCTKLGTLGVGSRCSVLVELTPLAAGPWSAELIMTHRGAGRLARMKVTGKTKGSGSSEKKETGLQLSAQTIKPVDFETFEVGTDRAVRTALMVNDSSDTIKIMSVEVIAPDNGLTKFEQGCAVDEELKPGESCPITLIWQPEQQGIVSTDLIIRHSGKRGFTVIPIRGVAKLSKSARKRLIDEGIGKVKVGDDVVESGGSENSIFMAPTASDLESMLQVSKISPVFEKALTEQQSEGTAFSQAQEIVGQLKSKPNLLKKLSLIGTVGNKALFYYRQQTFVVELGENFTLDDQEAILMGVGAREAEVKYNGKTSILSLKAVSALQRKAEKKAYAKRSVMEGNTGVSSSDDATTNPSGLNGPVAISKDK